MVNLNIGNQSPGKGLNPALILTAPSSSPLSFKCEIKTDFPINTNLL
jgi:hypothetical protein